MKINLKFIIITLFTLAITSCSPEDGMDGEQGPAGIDGNANVSSFTFSVNRSDWGDNLHYGQNNIFRGYEVSPDLIAGNSMNSIINEDGVVLVYAEPADVGVLTLVPFLFSYMGIGIKLNVDILRNQLVISKTTNGWDNVVIELNEIPSEIEYTIVLIPKEPQARMNNNGKSIDVNDYNKVAEIFNLEKK